MLVQCSTWRAERKFFSWSLFWCQFCWEWAFLLFCGEKYSGLPPSLPRRWEENWKLTISSKSSQDKQTSQLTPKPKTYPMPCPQGYWCPQAKLQETSSFRQPSPSRQEGSNDWEGESRQENKRLLYFPKRKYIWISIMRGISLKYRKLLNKGSKSQPCSNCQEQYDRWYCCYHHHHLGGTDPVLVHQSQRTQRWDRTWALAGTSFGEVPWGPSPSTGGSSSPLPQMQTETIEKL